jgi:hypothetical protein
MATHDQKFRTEAAYINKGKRPYIYFGDSERGALVSNGYINNSLEGAIFDASSAGTGQIVISSGVVTPNFGFYDAIGGAVWSISLVSIISGVCKMKATGTTDYVVGDIVAITGFPFSSTIPFVNGTWVVTSVTTTTFSNDTFTFEINAPNHGAEAGPGLAHKGFAFQIYDNRPLTDAKGDSFSSVLFTPTPTYSVAVGYKRVLPSDLYTRFRFQSYSDVTPQGGINSNLFNVVDSANNNIKPALWAYFFGYNDSTIASRASANHFEIAFNSYAIVLRPSGVGSTLEFALVKFNWGTDTENWMSSIVGTDRFKSYTISGTDLGYLVSTNPDVGKVAGVSVVSEIAKSDSFTYSSEFAAKFNLKITVRKHLLSDSILDGTYLVNLMINDSYNSFGEHAHYDSILHGYITKPSPVFMTTDGTQPHDSMLMPMMYFKFNNTDSANVGSLSSKIVQDSLMFRQINSVTATSYLY